MAFTYKYVDNASAGGGDGSSWSLSGASAAYTEAELEAYMEGTIAAETVMYIKGGTTYVLDSAYNWSARAGSIDTPIVWIGVVSTCTNTGANVVFSDWAQGNNRPLFDCGSQTITLSSYNIIRNIRFDGDAANMIVLAAADIFENCKFTSDKGSSTNQYIVQSANDGYFINCEFSSAKTHGLWINGIANIVKFCYFHDFSDATNGQAVYIAAQARQYIDNNIFDFCKYGIYSSGSFYGSIVNNTFYECDTGVYSSNYATVIMNNIQEGNNTVGFNWLASRKFNLFWGNHGDDTRCTDMWLNVATTGPSADLVVTTGDPLFTAAGSDFSLQYTSPCAASAEDVMYGVGASVRNGNKGAWQAATGDGLDLPALNKVAPSDTLLGSAGTMDLPAINKVAPSDTLEGVAGTMDLPALNKVAPSDTLEGVAGTMDLPTISNVRDNDTLEGVTGTLGSNYIIKSATPAGNYNDDNLTVGNVRPVAFGLSQTGTLANLDGTEAAYTALEATRNTDPGEGDVVEGTGTYKIANVTKTPSFNLATYENARNVPPANGAADLKLGQTMKIRNVNYTGTYNPSAGEVQPETTVSFTASITRTKSYTASITRTKSYTASITRTKSYTAHIVG
jgi:parallel beta-helix repeat protein